MRAHACTPAHPHPHTHVCTRALASRISFTGHCPCRYRKNIIIVWTHPSQRHFSFYREQLKKHFPSQADFDWIMENLYVEYHDRRGHTEVVLEDILWQLQLEDSTAPVPKPAGRNSRDMPIEEFLDEAKLSHYAAAFIKEGYEFLADLLDADDEDLGGLTAEMKKVEHKRLKRQLEQHKTSELQQTPVHAGHSAAGISRVGSHHTGHF